MVPNSFEVDWAEAAWAPAPPTRPTTASVTEAASRRVVRPNMRLFPLSRAGRTARRDACGRLVGTRVRRRGGVPVTVAAGAPPGWEGGVHDGLGCVRTYRDQTPTTHI